MKRQKDLRSAELFELEETRRHYDPVEVYQPQIFKMVEGKLVELEKEVTSKPAPLPEGIPPKEELDAKILEHRSKISQLAQMALSIKADLA